MSLVYPPAVRQKIPDGDAGSKLTLMAMRDLVRVYPCKKLVASIAQRITEKCQTDACRITEVHRWVTSVLKYKEDPPYEEEIKSPCRILTEYKDKGVAYDDCDGFSVLFAAAFMALGMRTAFCAVSNQKVSAENPQPMLDHVFTLVYDRENIVWKNVDTVAPPGKTWEGHRQIVEEITEDSNWFFMWLSSLFTPIKEAV